MKCRVLLTVIAFAVCFSLAAHDRDKQAGELAAIKLTLPQTVVKRSYDIKKGAAYSASALLSASHPQIAWIEVRLLENGREAKFFRSARNAEQPMRTSVVFHSGNCDRAEVRCVLLSDAVPGSFADFNEFRFTSCDDVRIQSWERRGPSRCVRKFAKDGSIVLIPNKGRNRGTVSTILTQYVPGSKYTLSADIISQLPGAGEIAVHLGGKGMKSLVLRSYPNKKLRERHELTFNTANYTWIMIELRCINGKKFNAKPVTFSNISITPAL